MPRKWIRAVLLLAGAVLTLVLTAATVPAATPGGKLSKEERAAIGKARAEGKSTVTCSSRLSPARPRRSSTACRGSARRSGTATTSSATSALPSTRQGRAGDCPRGRRGGRHRPGDPDARPAPGDVSPIVPFAAPSAATPRVNPYMPTQDTKAAQFVNAHPTWDGRGVDDRHRRHRRLARPSEPAHDEHRRAEDRRLGHGHDPVTDAIRRGSTCRLRSAARRSRSDGTTYTAPAAGSYRIGAFREANPRLRRRVRQRRADRDGDLNRDGDQPDIFAVLWNDATGQVWWDTDADRSFADQTGDDGTTRSTSTSAASAPTTPRPRSRIACRSSSRPTARTSTSTSASWRARTARTSPASRPATRCSAAT